MSIDKFNFYCQTALPAVYGEELSYYETLCKVKAKLNEVIDYVNTNLSGNISEIVLGILNQWRLDGTLDNIIKDGVFPEFEEKLNSLTAELNNTNITVSKIQNDLMELETSINSEIEIIKNNLTNLQNGLTTTNNNLKETTNMANTNSTNISSLDTRTTALEKTVNSPEVYLFIGDSYAQGWTPDGTTTGWPVLVKNVLNIHNDHFVSVNKGGVGFVTTNNGENFQTLMETAPGDHNIFTKIIVCGGYNDIGVNLQSLSTAIANFMTSARANFPNATVYLGFIGWNSNLTNYNNALIIKEKYQQLILGNGGFYLNNVENILHMDNYMASDGYHPNSAGQFRLGIGIANCIKTGNISLKYSYAQASVTASVGISNLSCAVGSYYNNEVTTINCTNISFNLSQNNVILNGQREFMVCNFSSTYFIGNPDSFTTTRCAATIGTGTSFIDANCTVIVRNKTIYMTFEALKPDGSDYLTANLRTVSVPYFSITAPSTSA